MAIAVIILALLMPMAMAAMFILARHLYRRPYGHEELSAGGVMAADAVPGHP